MKQAVEEKRIYIKDLASHARNQVEKHGFYLVETAISSILARRDVLMQQKGTGNVNQS